MVKLFHTSFSYQNQMRWPLLLLAVLFLSVPRAALGVDRLPQTIESMLSQGDGSQLCLSCPVEGYPEQITEFYSQRHFQALWIDQGQPAAWAIEAIRMLGNSFRHGLYPAEYHVTALQAFADHLKLPPDQDGQAALNDPEHLASFELMLTHSFAMFAEHLLNGLTDPDRLPEIWVRRMEPLDLAAVLAPLDQGLTMLDVERSLLPENGDYLALMQEADFLRLFAGSSGWTPLPEPENTRMEPGHAEEPFIPELRERFIRLGTIMDYEPEDPALYDEVLVEAVKEFQFMNGLDPDGIIGNQTREALNISDLERYHRLLANMERWRWLPRAWEDKVILVNVPAFRLRALRNDVEELEMKVIVGSTSNQTPIFSKAMRYIETNPYWNVPESIALDELLPKIRNNPDYLGRHNYELVDMRNNPGAVVAPDSLDWSRSDVLSGLRIRQVPGGWNALGIIKFMFPNRFDVYLHDTSQRHLFSRINRNLSHGCIRVADPLNLALFVLGDDPVWTLESIQAMLDSGQRRQVDLPTPLTVHIMYLTAEPLGNGTIRYFRDVYALDDDVWALLQQARPDEESMEQVSSL